LAGKAGKDFPNRERACFRVNNKRYFPKEEAYAGGLLKYLLREIYNEYNGKRGERGRRGEDKRNTKRKYA